MYLEKAVRYVQEMEICAKDIKTMQKMWKKEMKMKM